MFSGENSACPLPPHPNTHPNSVETPILFKCTLLNVVRVVHLHLPWATFTRYGTALECAPRNAFETPVMARSGDDWR